MANSQMTMGQFLRTVWPDQGFYCIAHPFTPPGTTKTVYAHKVFPTIGEAVTHCHTMAHQADTYFAILSLREERVWDAEKTDAKTGTKGAWATRPQQNILAAKTLFWDLDVGSEVGKYASQRDAVAALLAFLQQTGLPMPMMLSSGGGIHLYWPFTETIPVAEWRTMAWHLRQLGEHLGMLMDKTRTIDVASVLRVPETFNWKDRNNPRAVKIVEQGAGPQSVAALRRTLSDALVRHGVVASEAPTSRAPTLGPNHGLGAQTFNDFGPPPTIQEVAAVCGQMRTLIRASLDSTDKYFGQLDNTAWYRGLIGLVKHVEDGDNWCHKLTAPNPRSNSDIDDKLKQAEQFPPARCDALQQIMPWGDTPCQTCRFKDKVPNPVAAARKGTPAPPPVIGVAGPAAPPPPVDASGSAAPMIQLVAPSLAVLSLMIPNPPAPYTRLKAGGIAVNRKDKDGNDTTVTIYPHDLFPLKRLVNRENQTEQQVWRANLPRSGVRDFVLDADALYDMRKFVVAIANNGIYPNKADIPALQDYMTAYISQLQKDLDGEAQNNHLGWTDELRAFVLPDKILVEDGTVKAAALTTAAERASQFIVKRGALAEQIKLMHFYNKPEYVPNQSVILDSFASIIFHATGHHGIVVNCSGDAGASKSTTLYTAAAAWGDPALWPINGTNRGATPNALAQRIITNANLPTCVDEITHLPVKTAQDLVMNITQPGHRLRLQTDGTERRVADNYKSSIMIATANSSLHNLLSLDNAAGTAGSMRVFEIKFLAQRVHEKAEADEFLRQIRQHHGHLGEIFAQFVVRNRVAVEHRVQQVMREVDTEARITSAERFWSARIACNIVAGEVCRALGLLPYDPMPIRQWSISVQVPFMRGVVKDEYRDPLAILTDYIAEKHSNIVVIDKSLSIGANTTGSMVPGETAYAVNRPSGALLGHYDMKTGMLYILKQGFKDHCAKIGANSTQLLDELHQPRAVGVEPPSRVITDKSTRRTLGAGTDLAKGQSWCFAVNMRHPEISGAVPLVTVTGGTPSSAPAGNLRAVT